MQKALQKRLSMRRKLLVLQFALFDASDYKGKDLAKETHVILLLQPTVKVKRQIMLSSCMNFYNQRSPKLPNLEYGVIGLGDSSYEFFCQTGKDFDTFLEKLGAKRFIDRVDCDVDYDQPAAGGELKSLKLSKNRWQTLKLKLCNCQ